MTDHWEDCVNDRNRFLLIGGIAILAIAGLVLAIPDMRELALAYPVITSTAGGVALFVYVVGGLVLTNHASDAYKHRIIPGQPYY